MKLEIFLPMAGIVVGWLLNVIAQFVKGYKQDKKPISRALSELLEIKYSVIETEILLYEIQEKYEIPEETWIYVKKEMRRILLNNKIADFEEIKKRYNDAVNLICELEPLLGFKLRSKDLIGQLVQISEFNEIPELINIQKKIIHNSIPVFNETIILLAWKHGIVTWVKTKKYLSTPQKQLSDIILGHEDSINGIMSVLASLNMIEFLEAMQKDAKIV